MPTFILNICRNVHQPRSWFIVRRIMGIGMAFYWITALERCLN